MSSLEISTATLACINCENNYNQLQNNIRNTKENISKCESIFQNLIKKLEIDNIKELTTQLENIEINLKNKQ